MKIVAALVPLVCALLSVPGAVAATWPSWVPATALQSVPARFADSDAVVLADEWSITVKEGARSGQRHRVVRVLTEDGRDAASLVLTKGAFHRFSKVRLWVRQPQGRITRFDDEDGTLFGNSTRRMLDDTESLVLRPRGVGAGCVVAIEYRFDETADFPQDLYEIEEETPVLDKTIRLTIQGDRSVEARVAPGANPGPATATGDATWRFSDLPARRSGGQRSAPRPPRAKLLLTYLPPTGPTPFRDWNGVGRWGADLHRSVEGASPEVDQVVARMRGAADPIQEAANFVRRMRYYAIEIGWGGLIPRKPATTLARAFGDCKDKTELMVTILRRLGIAAVPVWAIAPSSNFVHNDLPSPFQFNHCIVGIPWAGRERRPGMVVVEAPGVGTLRLFDSTLPESFPQDISFHLEGGAGLPLDPNAGGLIRIPESGRDENLLETLYQSSLGPDGEIAVSIERRFHGAMRSMLEGDDGEVAEAEEIRRNLFREVSRDCPRLAALDVSPLTTRSEGPWILRASYRCPDGVVRAGALDVVDLPAWGNPDTFALPGEKGSDSSYAPFLGTSLQIYDLDLGDLRLAQAPKDHRVENSLGAVRVASKLEGTRLVVTREALVSAREIPRAKKDDAQQLQQALRRARTLSVIVRAAAGGGSD